MKRSPQQSTLVSACQVMVWSSVSPFSWRRENSTPPTERSSAVVVGAVGIAVFRRPVQVLEAELAAVDDRVVAGGEDVAVESGRQRMVGDDLWCAPSLLSRLLLPDRHPEDVVDVAVGVHGGVEARVAPAPDVAVDHLGQGQASGVHQDQPVVGVEGRDVGERRREADPVGDLDEPADVVDRVEVAVDTSPRQRRSAMVRTSSGTLPLPAFAEVTGRRPGVLSSPTCCRQASESARVRACRRPWPCRCSPRRLAVADAFLASPSPFSNSFLAEPRLRASLGMAAPPKRSTTTTMRTMITVGPRKCLPACVSPSAWSTWRWAHPSG